MSDIDSTAAPPPVDGADPIAAKLARHQMWLDSNGTDGTRFLANGLDFTGYDFAHRDLRGATFDSCRLDLCDFRFAQIGQVPFADGAMLVGCTMKGARFGGATFLQALILGGTISSSDFSYSTIRQSQFKDFVQVGGNSANDFSHATLDHSEFVNVKIDADALKNVVIDTTWFTHCVLDHVDFTTVVARSSLLFRNCSLARSHFKGMLVPGSQFRDCTVDFAVFDKMLFNDDSSFEGSSFDFAKLLACALQGCQLGKSYAGADLTGSNLSGASARLANFVNATLFACDLHEANFQGSNLQGVRWDGTTNLNLTNFTGCTWVDGKTCGANSYGICHEQD